VEIRHIEIGEQDRLSTRHPEFLEQHPELSRPVLVDSYLEDADFPYLFYAIDKGRIASHFGSFPDTLINGDRALRWAWNGNLYTEPDFRGRGIAQAIVQHQLREFARRNVIWGGVFSSPAALRLYERMGFCMLGYAPRLCIIRNIRPFLRHHTRNQIIVSGAGAIFDIAFNVSYRLLFRSSNFEQRYDVDLFDGSTFAALLERHHLVMPEKYHWSGSAAWFETRRAVRGIDNICTIRRRNDTAPCAFLIVRDRLLQKNLIKGKYTGIKMMSVMEFGQFDQELDIADALVGASLVLFRRSDADLIEFVTSSPSMRAAARRRGYFPLGDGMSFKFMAPVGNPIYGVETTIADWHLSHYSGDAFGFE
jgi:GNAT superfamily N-acetyltransferase